MHSFYFCHMNTMHIKIEKERKKESETLSLGFKYIYNTIIIIIIINFKNQQTLKKDLEVNKSKFCTILR
jgi:hypothetical protein